MEFFYFIKATQKSGKEDAVIWFTAKSEARANLQLDVELEDAGIETGRGKDYVKPVRTDFPVYNDLPEESAVDYTWCKRYELEADQRTWKIKQLTEEAREGTSEQTENISTDSSNAKTPVLTTVATLPLRQRILAQFITDEYAYHIDADQKKMIQQLEMDVDNSYVQNMLLAAENVEPFKAATEFDISKVVADLKTIFPADGKRTELAVVIQFFKAWFGTEHIDRGLLVKEWAKGNRVSVIQRTTSGTNAGGGNKTDRNPDLKHDLDSLDLEIALATLPMDFNIYDIPGGVFRRAKEIVSKKESPFKEWSKALRATPGILDYSRAAIFALIRSAHPEYYLYPARLSGYINANLTESNHSEPSEETLVAARHDPEVSWTNEVATDSVVETGGPESSGKNEGAQIDGETQPILEKVGNGLFSIEGLTTSNTEADQPNTAAEYVDNVQMEETGNDESTNGSPLSEGQEEVVTGESSTETDSDATALNNDSGHHNNDSANMLYTHLMVDIESMGKKPGAPIVSIGAVFFDPASGQTGPEFYKVISLESAMEWGGVPDASTILFWLKATPEARSEIIMDHAIPLDDALLQFKDFIAENAANGKDTVQVWGNGATFDNVLLEDSYARTGISCPWKYWNNRDVRTIVELGKAVGYTPRHEIPFEGEPHKAISDARHQVKYVSAIWQHLTEH
ncbi:3'-5' exoribonuclease [Enterobacter hormaechei subsp. steigerwaltii]|uniref:exonuclease n=1 Tax=Enterobacter hormaechei TaxID=158836 RepID=UPI00125895E4|nr:exonuclease [Enterobacter hormaechei]MCU2465708.1 3'-5' exoribonuclease [Enterobacter hormaechei subsp. steigerwaltii]MCU4097876.1 3'-5' exoribonuclease [Enterobacter hormaechei subsp. steigerwaltii]MCU4097933.1 3'-5' exoribonuclease [Enterobacter hormaechei subsp. steigerwaltii]VAG55927.1 exodeoxyribonuclease VIII [Enterobacter hormaechei]